MHIIIFKTNVFTQEQAGRLQGLLSAIRSTVQCNFDLYDCDHILRVVSTDLQPERICRLLQSEGFSCEEMESFVYN